MLGVTGLGVTGLGTFALHPCTAWLGAPGGWDGSGGGERPRGLPGMELLEELEVAGMLAFGVFAGSQVTGAGALPTSVRSPQSTSTQSKFPQVFLGLPPP